MADTSLYEKKIGLLIWHVSNHWQNKLRNILKKYNLSLNEYLIFEALAELESNLKPITQTSISSFSGIDISVVSVCLKSLSKKKYINRKLDNDNRKKIITFLKEGFQLYNEINPKIKLQENELFDKLKNEKINFCNSLKLIIGKKIRIKAGNIHENK